MQAPLIEMIGGKYSRSQKKHAITWTTDCEHAFEAIKVAINNCPKLFFRDEDLGAVYVQTDASNFGIGGYMFQLDKDGVTHVIRDTAQMGDSRQRGLRHLLFVEEMGTPPPRQRVCAPDGSSICRVQKTSLLTRCQGVVQRPLRRVRPQEWRWNFWSLSN